MDQANAETFDARCKLSTATPRPSLAVAIVNNEHWPSVLAQLLAYHAQSPELFQRTQWVVVHNGPLPLPAFRELEAACPEEVANVPIEFTANRGYGSAVNLALRQTTAGHLLALNADMLPEPGFFEGVHALVAELEARDRHGGGDKVATVGFRLVNPDGTEQGSVGRFPTLARIAFGLLRSRADRKYLRTRQDRLTEGPWTTGACLLLSRKFMLEVGGFDESFFMYYEDVDLCLRAWRHGWQVLFEPRLTLRHFEPYHRRRLTARMVYVARHGLLRYFWKHRPGWEFKALCRIVQLESRLRGKAPAWRQLGELASQMAVDADKAICDPARLPE